MINKNNKNLSRPVAPLQSVCLDSNNVLPVRRWHLEADKKTLQAMVKAKMYLGHVKSEVHPSMKQFIYGKQNDMHILNSVFTLFKLEQAARTVQEQTYKGKKTLLVATQMQSTGIVKEMSKACQTFFVNQKWVGGVLTNWKTVRASVRRLLMLDNFANDGRLYALPKKRAASLRRLSDRLNKGLSGLTGMTKWPGIVVLLNLDKDVNALCECRKLAPKIGLQTLAVVDSNCNSTLSDFVIPANDDSIASLAIVLTSLGNAIKWGSLSKVGHRQEQKNIVSEPSFSQHLINQKQPFVKISGRPDSMGRLKSPINNLTLLTKNEKPAVDRQKRALLGKKLNDYRSLTNHTNNTRNSGLSSAEAPKKIQERKPCKILKWVKLSMMTHLEINKLDLLQTTEASILLPKPSNLVRSKKSNLPSPSRRTGF